MIDKIYKGIGRTSDTKVYELLPKLHLLTLEGQDEDGELIWSGHQDRFKDVEYLISYYEEHGQFPTDDFESFDLVDALLEDHLNKLDDEAERIGDQMREDNN